LKISGDKGVEFEFDIKPDNRKGVDEIVEACHSNAFVHARDKVKLKRELTEALLNYIKKQQMNSVLSKFSVEYLVNIVSGVSMITEL